MISETPDKYITSMWNDWKEKVCDSRMPDSWSWPCVWDDYSGMEDLQDLKLRERIYLADILTCQFCSSVMETPYTLQCGCSSCKSCCKMDSQSISIDHICVLCSKESYLNSKTLKVNVVLNSFLNKWFTDFSRALKLNRKGHTALKCKEFDTGVKCFDQAVELCKYHHLVVASAMVKIYIHYVMHFLYGIITSNLWMNFEKGISIK